MRKFAVAVAMLLVGAGLAPAKFEIKDVKAVLGLYGPERKDLNVLPGDEVFFRFTLAGVQRDDQGRINCLLTLSLKDSSGKELLDAKQRTNLLRETLALGGDSLISSAYVGLSDNFPAGDFTYTVTVEDQIAKEKDSFTRKIVCVKPKFAMVALRFYRDAGYSVPTPVGGLVGQGLFFRFKAIGLNREQDKIECEMQVDILDASGKSTMPQPIVAKFLLDEAEKVKQVSSLNFNGSLVLNRPGDFTLKITISDKRAKQSATFEAPMKVTAP
jgi:hypothetical protein